MDFRKEALSMLDEMSGVVSKKAILETEKKTNLVDVELVLEGLDGEISKKIQAEVKSEPIVEDFRPRF